MSSLITKLFFIKSSSQDPNHQNYISMISQHNRSDRVLCTEDRHNETGDNQNQEIHASDNKNDNGIFYKPKFDSTFTFESDLDLDSDGDTIYGDSDEASNKEIQINDISFKNLNSKTLSISIQLNDDIENQLFELTNNNNFFKFQNHNQNQNQNKNKNKNSYLISNLKSILNSNQPSLQRNHSFLTSDFFQNFALFISIMIFFITTYYYCNPPRINISLSCLIEAFKKNNYDEQMFIIQKLSEVAESSRNA
ncbi:uncharacterized protein ASCRUDRAFT_74321 [Ascoidea rubescens DSM 1968]|uniref:Transmembrane protein n=1 Tax=Ascoidea rubescens DSM 1968 TaxID=1344418 RepID=A0A1D2VMS3_9ASCO|nr:hypothetical protein ASCRUDRAFT_74321 [Ascoidea rubescens DSM 1968]ODV62867.1 hypothetical protein ASCRUDRAFT_74321 [Ascoidea rubescens DSM 1968]